MPGPRLPPLKAADAGTDSRMRRAGHLTDCRRRGETSPALGRLRRRVLCLCPIQPFVRHYGEVVADHGIVAYLGEFEQPGSFVPAKLCLCAVHGRSSQEAIITTWKLPGSKFRLFG
jgi:hypothetical protein